MIKLSLTTEQELGFIPTVVKNLHLINLKSVFIFISMLNKGPNSMNLRGC